MGANRSITIFINGKEVENSIKSIKNEYVKLYNEVAKMTPAQAGYNEKVAELKRTKRILDDHYASLKSSGSMWDKMKIGISSAIPILAGAFGVIKSGEAILKSTGDSADTFESTMSGLNNTLNYLKISISNWEFSFKGLRDAFQAGKKYAEMLDEVGDKTIALGFAESDAATEILALKKSTYDVNKTDEERLEIIDKILAKEDELQQKRVEIKTEAHKGEVEFVASNRKLKEEEVLAFIRQEDEIIKQYEEGLKKREELNSKKSALKAKESINPFSLSASDLALKMVLSDTDKEKLKKDIDFIEKNYGKLIDLATRLGQITDEEREAILKSYQEQGEAQRSADENNQKLYKRKQSLIEELIKGKKKETDDYAKAEQALNDKIRKLQNDIDTYNLSSKEKEILQTKQKYAALYDEAKGHNSAIVKLKQLEAQELLAIDIKYANDAIKESQKLADKLIKANEDKFKNVVKANKDESDAVREIELALTDEADRKKKEEIFAIEDKYAKLIDLAKKYGFDTVGLQQQMAKELANVETNHMHPFGMNDEQWEQFQKDFQNIQELAGITLNAFQAVNDIMNANDEERLRKAEESNNKQKESLERRLNAGVISQTQYNRRVANLDKDLDSKKKTIEKEQAEREKKLRIFQTIVNTAAAIVGFLANPGGPWGLGLSIAAGITGAIQLAAIVKAKPFAKGGRIKKETFARMGEAGEEGVISNKTLTDPFTGPISNWLLDKQDGKNPVFPTTIAPAQYSQQSSSSSSASVAPIVNVSVPQQDNSELLVEIRKMNAFLTDPKNRQAYISNDILTRNTEDQNFRNSLQRVKKN